MCELIRVGRFIDLPEICTAAGIKFSAKWENMFDFFRCRLMLLCNSCSSVLKFLEWMMKSLHVLELIVVRDTCFESDESNQLVLLASFNVITRLLF